ncbi:hypothetical protein [Sphingomonas soli]|uniref:hypothetical protein n=1 Tax=Sphingomonas soli TaxID=266127 RepID=UPI000AF51FA6|nr:hypothetical protein [Sphingomonas soli]
MMHARRIAGAVAMIGMVASSAALAQDQVKRLNFVGCPIVRDTEMVPCWLAEHKGELYYLGLQLDLQDPFFPPQLLHKALVEGVVTDKPRICGGIVLEPVKVATMPELDPSCNTILPAEGHVITGARRGTGPDPDVLSARNQLRARQVTKYDPPFEKKTFTVYFDFDDTYMPTRANRNVTEAMRYATASKAGSVRVIAYRGGAKLSDGTKLTEQDAVIAERVENIRFALVDIGVPAEAVSVEPKVRPERYTGVDDYKTRRVEIVVTP